MAYFNDGELPLIYLSFLHFAKRRRLSMKKYPVLSSDYGAPYRSIFSLHCCVLY